MNFLMSIGLLYTVYATIVDYGNRGEALPDMLAPFAGQITSGYNLLTPAERVDGNQVHLALLITGGTITDEALKCAVVAARQLIVERMPTTKRGTN